MGSIYEGGEPALDLRFSMVLALAQALREEFGVGIDAHPGGVGCEAGTVNRAFLTAAGVILGSIPPGDDPAVLDWILRQTAFRRLHELGVSGQQAEALLVMEPMLGDAWLAYLALAPVPVVLDLLSR